VLQIIVVPQGERPNKSSYQIHDVLVALPGYTRQLVSEMNEFQREEYGVTTGSGNPAVHASQNGRQPRKDANQQTSRPRNPRRNNETNQNYLLKTVKKEMQATIGKMEAGIHSIPSEIENTNQRTQNLRKELTESIERTQVKLQTVEVPLDVQTTEFLKDSRHQVRCNQRKDTRNLAPVRDRGRTQPLVGPGEIDVPNHSTEGPGSGRATRHSDQYELQGDPPGPRGPVRRPTICRRLPLSINNKDTGGRRIPADFASAI
jgi:hypothetical protein